MMSCHFQKMLRIKIIEENDARKNYTSVATSGAMLAKKKDFPEWRNNKRRDG